MAKCKVCGAPHRSCGPSTTVIPVDERIETREQGDMSLKRYTITSGRRGEHTVTVKLSDDEAKRLGVFDQSAPSEGKPAAKKAPAKTSTPRKARTPRNKAAKPAADKAAETAPATPPAGSVEDASDPDASE